MVIELEGPGTLHELLLDTLPSARPSTATTHHVAYEVRKRTADGTTLGWEVWRSDGTLIIRAKEPETVARGLTDAVHFEIASHATDHVFIHAGVVGWHDQAIVIPGRSMSGKTTLVIELLRQGASYYSDEYAVIDTDGLVHPYARELRVRSGDGSAENKPFGNFTTHLGRMPIPLGMIAVLHYEEGAELRLSRLGPGAAALALIDNTIRVRDEPASSVRAASMAGRALGIEGVRGEAAEAAATLLERASHAFSSE